MSPLLKLLFFNFSVIGTNPYNRNCLAYFLTFLTCISIVILTMASVLDVTTAWRGIDTLDDFYMFPLVLVFPAKLSCIALRPKLFIQMVNKIQMFWPHDKFGKEVENKMKRLKKITYIVVATFSVIYFGLVCIHIFVPIALHEKGLVYPGVYWCNLTIPSCFDSVFYWQLASLVFQITPSILGFECLFIYFVHEAFCSIEMVKYGLRRIKSADDDAKKNIGEIAHQHAIILSFIDDMRVFYNEVLLTQFWSSLGTMVFSLYMLTAESFPPPIGQLIKFGGSLYFLSVQLFIYCFGGSLVLEQTLTVSDEAYFVDWWAKASIRRDLALIIARSQKASTLLVGKMSILNLDQFITVLRNAVNVCGILMTIKRSEEMTN